MANNIFTATVSRDTRDCDGSQSYAYDVKMTDEERASQFGDLDFFDRVMCMIYSPNAVDATITIRQHNGHPVFEYNESTEEGYDHKQVTFTKE